MNFRMKAVGLSIIAAAALVACGGGDDSTPTPAPSVTGPATTAPTSTPSTGAEATGTLTYDVLKQDGTSEVASATSVYAKPNGTLTLYPDDAAKKVTLSTTTDWSSVTWAGAATRGAIRGSGNALQLCPSSGGSQVALSHNMVRVTDLTALRGKTFEYYECTTSGVTKAPAVTFNADGTATAEGNSISAQEIATVFSAAGEIDPDGSTFKLVAYSLTRAGLPIRYFLRELTNDKSVGGKGQQVMLSAEVEPS